MRFSTLALLVLICSATISAQPREVVVDRGNFGLHTVNDSIHQYKYLERENQLLLIGWQNVQLIDLNNFKIIETRPLKMPITEIRPEYQHEDWPISPDGRFLLLIGLNDARTKTKTETKQAAWALDLQTGKRIRLLEHPDLIRTAAWSKNGKTLMTTDAFYIGSLTRTLNVSFYDGETFKYRNSVTIDNVTWTYLSNDGERFFAASGKQKNLLGIKYVADADSVVRIWKTGSGELEKTIAVADKNFHPKTREIEISPDEKFLLMVNKHKSNPSENRLLAWEINGSIEPKYSLQPQPKIDDSRTEFSPDGTHFALDVGKNLQIYETATGKLKVELADVELPSWGWMDNNVLASVNTKQRNLFKRDLLLKAFDATDGRLLFKQRMAFDENEVYNAADFTEAGTEVTDYTVLRPHPTKKLYMTFSNEFVKIFDSRTGAWLQTVVHPLIRVELSGKQRMTHGKTVEAADWTRDGRALYVFSANRTSVSLWQLVDN